MVEEVRSKSEHLFMFEGLNCAESVLRGVLDGLSIGYNPELLAVTHGFGSGISGGGCVCGALSGGVMAVGYINAQKGTKNKTRAISRAIYDQFIERNKCSCCRILSQRFPKGSQEARQQCARFVGEVAQDIAELISK